MFTIAVLRNTGVTANPLSAQTFSWNLRENAKTPGLILILSLTKIEIKKPEI